MPATASKKIRKNEREATKYEGVYQRVFYDQKYEGKPVISFTIDYYNPQTGKRQAKKPLFPVRTRGTTSRG